MDQHRWTRRQPIGCRYRTASPTRVHDAADFQRRLEGLVIEVEGSCVRVIERRDVVELLRGFRL